MAGQPGAARRAASTLVSAEASRLEEARVEALELRIQADLGCGRQAQVVAELRRLLADHPIREGMWALLMRALYSSGRQAEALEAYAQAREVIADELGVDPSAELRQLHEQMLQADAAPGAQFSATKTAAADSPFTSAPVPAAGTVPAGGGAGPPGPVTGFAPTVILPAAPVAQLPADIPDFTGRAEHVQNLRDLLAGPGRPDSPGAVVVAAVIGAGRPGQDHPGGPCRAPAARAVPGRPAVRQPARREPRSRPRPATCWPGSCGIWGWTRGAFRRARRSVRRSSGAG